MTSRRALLIKACTIPVLACFGGPSLASDDPKTRPDTRPGGREIAWGKAQPDGLEYGVAFDDQKKKYNVAERISFVLMARNPIQHAVDGEFSTESAYYAPPAVVEAAGKPVKVDPPTAIFLGVWAIIRFTLQPGEEKALGSASLYFYTEPPAADVQSLQMVAHAGAGKFKVSYPRTGTLDVEIKNP